MAPDPDPPPPLYQTDYDPNTKIDGLPATLTIVEIYPAIMLEQPDDLLAASQGWSLLGTTVWGSSQDMLTAADKLRPDWKSDAAEYFFPYIDRTRQSLGEWEQICYTNAQALSALSETVEELQRHMQQIWESFKAAQQQNYTDENSGGIGEWFTDVGESVSGDTRINDTLKKFTEQTQNEVLTPFSNAFSAAWSALTDAPGFRGPKDAEVPADGYQQRILRTLLPAMPGGVPAMPGGSTGPAGPPPSPPAPVAPVVAPVPPPAPPSAPVPPGGWSAMPVPPPLPIAPVAPITPVIPVAPGLPGSLRTPPAPPGPPSELTPNRLRPSSFDSSPGAFPQAPDAPGLSRFGGTPNAPGTGAFERSAAAAAPGEPPGPGARPEALGPGGSRFGLPSSLQGRSAGPVAPPGSEPGIPQPPRPGGPGIPPQSRSMPPGLPGRNRPRGGRPTQPGTRQPGEIDFPGAENTGTPSLCGRAGLPFGGPGGLPRSPGGPLSPAEPDVPRGLQGMRGKAADHKAGGTTEFGSDLSRRSAVRLDGRLGASGFGPAETAEDARSALRPGLGGRGAGAPDYLRPPSPVARSGRGGRQDRERGAADNAPVYVGIDERFEVEESGPAVIERPADRAPVTRPGPALNAPTKRARATD